MNLQFIPASARAVVGLALLMALPSLSGAQTTADPGRPVVLDVSSVSLEKNVQLSSLIAEIRSQVDAFVFLSGGASRMLADQQRQLLAMFEALTLVARGGRRIAVGDGGTQAGIMEAAGHARRASGGAFPLIGVAPAREVPPRGKTPLDPNHSHVVAVDNPSAPAKDSWGSETEAMYWLFAKLAEGRPSVTIVANGGWHHTGGGRVQRPRRAPHDSDRGQRPGSRCARLPVAEDAGFRCRGRQSSRTG
jgi:hypothetical protein